MKEIAAAIPPFNLTYSGLGCFPRPTSARVLWAGIQANDALRQLHERITSSTAAIGQALENREFKPHLTLARIEAFDRAKASALQQLFAKYSHAIDQPWQVQEVLVMRSHLSPHGARYEPLLSAKLGG